MLLDTFSRKASYTSFERSDIIYILNPEDLGFGIALQMYPL